MITLGIDIGQKRRTTGLCVAELEDRQDDRRHYLVRHLERLPAGTSYPALTTRLAHIATRVQHRRRESLHVYANATGLGQPIVDLLSDTAPLGPIYPVFFNFGDQRTVEGRRIQLGKAYLVSQLQVLLQTDRLHLPRTHQTEELAEDLLSFEMELKEDANHRYGAFPVGRHDDLVTALGLAVHHEPPRPGIY